MPKIYSLPPELYDAAVKSGLNNQMDAYIREIGFPSCKYVQGLDNPIIGNSMIMTSFGLY